MKHKESDYLNKLFANSVDEAGESEIDFPLVDVPNNLSENLYAIAETKSSLASVTPLGKRMRASWPKITSIAASVLLAVVVFQMYQQQQTLEQLKQAQSDLATALHYLGEANEITRAQMLNSVNRNMKKAAVAPVAEIGRESVLPSIKTRKPEPNNPSLSL